MRTLNVSVLLLFFAAYLPVLTGTDAPGQSYGEVSTGLDYPDMEGGRTEIEMVDVDGDGDIDLAMVGDHGSPGVNTDQQGVTVWFGDGTGVWVPAQFGDFGYGGIALGDVNGDGLIDVGYGVHHNWSSTDLGDQILEVALGNGSGTFWTAWDDGLATNGEDWGMMGSDFADVDADGDLDLGSISFGCCNGVRVYLNHGDGTWTQVFENSGRNSNQELVFGEINGDGWPDFAASHSLGTVYLSDGSGGFAVSDEGLPPTDEFDFLKGVALGDVNVDGRDDLAFVNDAGGIEVWTRGAGVWTDIGGTLPDTGGWSATQLWDLDGDGITDLAAFGNGQAATWKGDGAGGWTPLGSFTTQNPGTHTAFRTGGDIDHNGYPDFVVISRKQISIFDDRNIPQCFRELTPAATLSARIEKPVPGMTLRSGSAAFVHWAVEVPGPDPATVDLEYAVLGAAGPWHNVATGLPNNGRHQWIVPDTARAADFRLRVTVHTPAAGSVSAVSAGPMSILFGSGTVALRFDDEQTLTWTDRTTGRPVHHLYRGDWATFLVTGEYTQPPGGAAARWCDVSGGSQDDTYVPAPGEMVFYLATGVTDGLEGALDADSAGTERANAHPCD